MAREPGGLSAFGEDARAAWDRVIADYFAPSRSPHLAAAPDARTPDLVPVDWPAYPLRASDCLGRERADRLLDWSASSGAVGRRFFQEEYLEWRVVRDPRDGLQRVEITTEFPEYWRVLAAHQPRETLELVARFAGEQQVSPQAVYGQLDPFADDVGPRERAAAFGRVMLREDAATAWSPYNSGELAICCMCHGSNTLGALIALVLGAAVPVATEDPAGAAVRPLSGEEAIAAIGGDFAVSCRNSDPTVVEALVRLASAGHVVALDDPIGVYIVDVKHERLRHRDGTPVPSEWFALDRGLSAEAGDGFQRFQRLTLEVPEGEDVRIGDLVDQNDDRPIEHGGQVADLVQLAAYARVSPPDVQPPERRLVPAPEITPCGEAHPGCETYRSAWSQFEGGG